MLKRILAILGQGGTHSKAKLARQLEVSEDALERMLAQLVAGGYLRIVEGGCDGACGGCSLASGCAVQGSGRLWTLTEKGSRLVGEEEASIELPGIESPV